MMQSLALFGGMGVLSLLPAVLTIAALIDIVRSGADWYWIPVVLFFPVAGPLSYFLLVRSPWAGGRFASLSPSAARRIQATRRLRELAVQLAHWRGPAILVEAGEELLILGKHAEAERHLREAQNVGADPEDVGYPLAQALAMQGRYAEALPLLEPLVRAKPDHRFGAVQLHLARCYDEAGRAEDAERELRDLLSRRSFFEAHVRLARLMLRRGALAEAKTVLADVLASAAGLPHYLKRQQRAWIRAARRLKTGHERLPAPRIEGSLPPGRRLRLALAAGGTIVVGAAVLVGLWVYPWVSSVGRFGELAQLETDARERLEALERPAAAPIVTAELTDAAIERYLALRRALDPVALELVATLGEAPADEPVDSTHAMRQMEHRWKARIALLQQTHDALRSAGMARSDLEGLLTAIDWRCLQRPEAKVLSIPPHFRQEWYTAGVMETEGDEEAELAEEEESWRRQMARARADAQARRRDIDRLAAPAALAPAEAEVCDRQRARLRQLEGRAVRGLLCAVDAGMGCT